MQKLSLLQDETWQMGYNFIIISKALEDGGTPRGGSSMIKGLGGSGSG